jgi:hypothetical protein
VGEGGDPEGGGVELKERTARHTIDSAKAAAKMTDDE